MLYNNVNKVVTFYGNQTKTWSYKVTPPAGTGDINGSGGDPDLADAILALQTLAGLNPAGVNVGADVNNDGKIGLEEVIYILQKSAGLR
jgi:hypothetical protein